MIKLFRNIRLNLISNGKTGKYVKYAVGEIILVVIGILIALQINNWNEVKKQNEIERRLFENLITSLKKDSAEVNRIILLQSNSFNIQNRIINSSFSEFAGSGTAQEISRNLFDLHTGAWSFFPKLGVYNSIVSSKGIDFINSESIKSKLIELYDYQYKRYESIDKVLDAKFQDELFPFLGHRLKFYVGYDFEYSTVNLDDLATCYSDLQIECRNLLWQTVPSLKLLREIEGNINVLVSEMENQSPE